MNKRFKLPIMFFVVTSAIRGIHKLVHIQNTHLDLGLYVFTLVLGLISAILLIRALFFSLK